MAIAEKVLGQARENSTNAVEVYSPSVGYAGIVKGIFVANQSGADATVRIFVDENGSTYDETTTIMWDVPVPANTSLVIDTFIALDDSNSTLGYRSSVANALTITIFGAEVA